MTLLKWYDGWDEPSSWEDVRIVETETGIEVRTRTSDYILSVKWDQVDAFESEGIRIDDVNWRLEF